MECIRHTTWTPWDETCKKCGKRLDGKPTGADIEAAVFEAYVEASCEECVEFHPDRFVIELRSRGFEVTAR